MPLRTFLFALLLALPAMTVQADWRDWLDSARDALSGEPSQAEMTDALRQALAQGADVAVDQLGRPDGFLKRPEVRIGIPEPLQPLASGLRRIGQHEPVDAFEQSINRAAEMAVPASLAVLKQAIREITIADAQAILNGGETAATDYLRDIGGDEIRARMRPIVEEATNQAGVTRYYKGLVDKAGFLGGLIDVQAYDLDRYVTEQAADGLFTLIAEEEKRIRHDPAARTTELLQKVFGQ